MNQEYEKRIKRASEASNEFFEEIEKTGNMEMLQKHEHIDELFLQAFDVAGNATEEEKDFYFEYSIFYEYKAYYMIVNGVLEKKLNGTKVLNAIELKSLQDQVTVIMNDAIAQNDRYKSDYLENKENIIGELNKQLKEHGFTVKTGGCFIATAVYGSYDCPQVWLLRRYRDTRLADSYLGRMFIRIYYFISPFLVKQFGSRKWFIDSWRLLLDVIVDRLLRNGYEDTPYSDELQN